jgi:uncharacterized DUF497 family protein
MYIEFDAAKNQSNIRDRALSFESVAKFDFSTAAIVRDVRRDYPEERLVAVGFLGKRLHVLCFTPLPTGKWVISFRKANTREVKDYEHARTADR